jgi:hypothetical protein
MVICSKHLLKLFDIALKGGRVVEFRFLAAKLHDTSAVAWRIRSSGFGSADVSGQ